MSVMLHIDKGNVHRGQGAERCIKAELERTLCKVRTFCKVTMGIVYIILREDDVVFTIGHCRDMEELAEVFRPYIVGDRFTVVTDIAEHDRAATIVTNIREILKRMGAMLEGLSDTARVGENNVHYKFACELLEVSLDMPPEWLQSV